MVKFPSHFTKVTIQAFEISVQITIGVVYIRKQITIHWHALFKKTCIQNAGWSNQRVWVLARLFLPK